MTSRLKYLLDGRLFEWTFSAGTLWLAVDVFRFPDSLAMGAFHRVTDFMDPYTLVAYSFIISVIGMIALAANGRSRVTGPIVRSICAVGRAFIWSQFAYALHLLGTTQPSPSAGLGFWVLFTCAELYVAYRAMDDVQRAL